MYLCIYNKIGFWKENEKEGLGTMYYENGVIFEGEFKKDLENG